MGSFNTTCVISGLPIEARDPVRFMLLTENRYGGLRHACYVTSAWQPRTVPLRAEYNDYGSIENIQESLSERVFFKLFDLDVVEKGVGDNQCHDVHVRKGMSRAEWLEALWEARVFVDDDAMARNPNYVHEDKDEYHDKGVPTISRLEKTLRAADMPLTTEWGAKGFVIDEVIAGYVRVRYGRFGEEVKALEKALEIIKGAGYAAMITCGSGNYPNDAEILVAPLPGVVAVNGTSFRLSVRGLNPEESKTERAVSQAMIREDVWQILCNTKLRSWRDEAWTLDFFKERARAALVADREWKEAHEKITDPLLRDLSAMRHALRDGDDESSNFFFQLMRGAEGVSGVYFREAFNLATSMASSEEELETFAEELAETMFVQAAYANLHGLWHPTLSSSGQDAAWKDHRKFLRALTKIRGRWEDE